MASNKIVMERDGNTLIVTFGEKFDFENGRKFYSECEKQTGVEKYILDFKNVNFIDSSALGRMLYLRTKAGDDKANITLRNANKMILDIFKISQFHQLFKIETA